MNKIKKYLWEIFSQLFRIVPAEVLIILCRLAFEALSRGKDVKANLISLFNARDSLNWYLDRQAIRYGDGVHAKHKLMDYHRFFIERISPGTSVLDVGCGNGAVSLSMAQAGARVTGVDLDHDNITFAREHHCHANITYIENDIISDPPDETYEVIVMSNVLEHIDRRVDFLSSLIKLYKPRKILIRVPMINRHWDVSLKKELDLFCFSDPTHFTEYTLDSFRAEMTSAGLILDYYRIVWGEIWAEVHSGA